MHARSRRRLHPEGIEHREHLLQGIPSDLVEEVRLGGRRANSGAGEGLWIRSSGGRGAVAAWPPGRSQRVDSWPQAVSARSASGFATASSAKRYGRKVFVCPDPDRMVASHGPRRSPRPPSRQSLRIGRSGARTLGCRAHRPVPRRGRCATGGRDRVRLRCPAVVHPSTTASSACAFGSPAS